MKSVCLKYFVNECYRLLKRQNYLLCIIFIVCFIIIAAQSDFVNSIYYNYYNERVFWNITAVRPKGLFVNI